MLLSTLLGKLVFTVLDRSFWTSSIYNDDNFLGQAVVDLSNIPYTHVTDACEMVLDLELKENTAGVYRRGEKVGFVSGEAREGPYGSLQLRIPLLLPSEDRMCGWLFELSKNLFGFISASRIWVVLEGTEIRWAKHY